MEHRRVCFCMLSLLPLVQISKLSQANSLLFGKVCCRTPRGVRGLKLHHTESNPDGTLSHPSRGAWIEMPYRPTFAIGQRSHPSRGAWIEISERMTMPAENCGRTPRGVRGLKYALSNLQTAPLERRTPRGVRGLK